MWLSGLIICYGLRKKEQLRARLAASGQVWTAHESAARELMSLDLEDMQQQVDKMTNEQLAQVAKRMMEVSGRQAHAQQQSVLEDNHGMLTTTSPATVTARDAQHGLLLGLCVFWHMLL